MRERGLPLARRLLPALVKAGVPVALGTEGPRSYAPDQNTVLLEMRLLRGAGLTPAEVLRAATVDGARVLGLSDRKGRVAAGMDADLVFLETNPLRDVEALGRPTAVMVRGTLLSQKELGWLRTIR